MSGQLGHELWGWPRVDPISSRKAQSAPAATPAATPATVPSATHVPPPPPRADDPRDDPHDTIGRPPAPPLVRALVMLLAFAGMIVFAAYLGRATLEPSAASESLTHTNLRPGDSIREYFQQGSVAETLKQLGGNVVLGMPFGVLLPVMAPQMRGLLRSAFATALVMLAVELVQGNLVTGRAFDIDDVILNSTGAALGYLLLGRRLGRAVHPRRHHWWHRWTRRPRPGGELRALDRR